jgi:hypothetical protein
MWTCPCLDVLHQPGQGRSLHCATGHTAIIIATADLGPAFMALAVDEGSAGLALGTQRVELLLKALLRGFTGIDGAVANGSLGHGSQRPSSACDDDRSLRVFRPKNTGPDHFWPVISLAMRDRLFQVRPFHSKPASVTSTSWVVPCHWRISRVPALGRGAAGVIDLASLPPPATCLSRRARAGLRPPQRCSCRRWASERTSRSRLICRNGGLP